MTTPPVIDTFTQAGDTVIAHSPEAARPYREAAEKAALVGPGRVFPGRPPVAPAEAAPLPMVHVARQAAGREINRLQAEAAKVQRDLDRGPFGASGATTTYLVELHKQWRAGLEVIRARISEIESMSDAEVQRFAAGLGYR